MAYILVGSGKEPSPSGRDENGVLQFDNCEALGSHILDEDEVSKGAGVVMCFLCKQGILVGN